MSSAFPPSSASSYPSTQSSQNNNNNNINGADGNNNHNLNSSSSPPSSSSSSSMAPSLSLSPSPLPLPVPLPPPSLEISESHRHGSLFVNVWRENFHDEMKRIGELVDTCGWVSMDTEFPGVVSRPINVKQSDFAYHSMKCNVDSLKLLQLGLSFFLPNGFPLHPTCCWQFNFKFSLHEDIYAQDSIDLLGKSGMDFKEHERRGIDPHEFAECIMSSGIVLNENLKWITFHSSYDFGYLLKILTASPLPSTEQQFFDLLALYFPQYYDIKVLLGNIPQFHGGLQKLADHLQVERVGAQHQAGSDALVTALAFFKLQQKYFNGNVDYATYGNQLFGLTSPPVTVKKVNEDEEEEEHFNQSEINKNNNNNNNNNITNNHINHHSHSTGNPSAYTAASSSSSPWSNHSSSSSSSAFPGLLPSSKFSTPDSKMKRKPNERTFNQNGFASPDFTP